ncbi:MAG: gas vesicle protein GvpD [Methanomassiliicoccales archaeon]|nr:gas vesicle protein GvpD [Methanomassiliicoccales archaeon]
MKKRYECPRCGAGIRPDDIQCDRCGEILKPIEPQADTMPVSVTVEKVISEEEIPIVFGQSEYLSLSRQKQLLAQKEKEIAKREKELMERENRLMEAIESLERDNRALEEAMKRCTEFEAELRAREKILRDREKELDALAEKLERSMRELEISTDSGRKMRVSTEEFEKLLALREDYQKAIEEGLSRMRKQVEEELRERFEKLSQLEQQLRAAEASFERKITSATEIAERGVAEEPEESVASIVDISKIVDELKKEIDVQIGAGFAEKPKDVKIRTHIERLDVALDGGIPKGSVVLVNGIAGTMKSTLTYAILHNCAVLDNINSMYFSLEQSRESLIRQMERLGMPREKSRDRLMVVDMIDLRKRMAKEKGDWRSILMRYVSNVKKEWDFQLFVLDSLDSFKSLADYELTRQDLKDIFDWFKSLDITVFLISEKPIASMLENSESEVYLADGVIELHMKELDHGRMQRWLRVMKMRGSNIDPRYFSFSHDGTRFSISVPIVNRDGPS